MVLKLDKRYLGQLKLRYKKSTKKQKKIILDEFTKTLSYDRKHAIKLLTGNYQHQKGSIHHHSHRIYTKEDAEILKQVCELLGWICSKRMKPSLTLAVDELIKVGKVTISRENRKRVTGISPATMNRLFKRYKIRPKLKGRSYYTKPGTLLKSQIPVRTFSEWNENRVGFFEIDLVGHDGSLVKGDFALLGLDSDSGAEFINDQLYRYCIQEKITFTRGRPGKKNDNPYVEEKNDSIIRNWVGYGRYDTQVQVDTLNELYELLRLYTNFFLPVMKLKKKIRIGSKIKKVHDKAATPYRRILRAKDVSKEVKDKLRAQYKSLSLLPLII